MGQEGIGSNGSEVKLSDDQEVISMGRMQTRFYVAGYDWVYWVTGTPDVVWPSPVAICHFVGGYAWWEGESHVVGHK